MKKLLVFLRDYKKESVLAPLFKLLEASFELFVPLVMAKIIDVGIGTGDNSYVLKMCGVLILLAFIGLTCAITAQYFAAKAAVGFATKLRHALFEHIQKLSFDELDRIGTSTLITRMTSDINQVQSGVNLVLRLFLRSPFIVFGAMIMAFTVDTKAALVFVVTIPLLSVVVFGIMLVTMPLYKKVQSNLDSVLLTTRENLTGARVIRAFNKEEDVIATFKRDNDILYTSAWKSQFLSGMMMPIMQFVGNLGYVGEVILGGYLAMKGTIQVGDIQSFIQYVRSFTMPIQQVAQVANMLQSTAAASERVFEFLDEEEEVQQPENPDSIEGLEGNVQFEHVEFGYNPDKIIIHDFSADIHDGQKIAIVGPTGAGKTTMVKLLMRFYDVNKGVIKVDGHDVKNFNRSELHEMFGMVLQDTWLFSGTIMENIRYGRPDASDEEVEQAAKTASAHSFIMRLEDGYDTVLEGDGTNLSQGQRQLLNIARAALSLAPILVLDEATSSVDTRTEMHIDHGMERLMKNRTTFVIAHRLSTVRNSDCIMVLENGRIIERGNHDQLMELKGRYYQLYTGGLAAS